MRYLWGLLLLPPLLEINTSLERIHLWISRPPSWIRLPSSRPNLLGVGRTLQFYISFDCVCDLWILCCYSSGCVIGYCLSEFLFVFLGAHPFSPPSVKRSILGFHPTTSWYHEQGSFTSWSPYPPLSSFILLFLVLIRKSSPKIAPKKFLAICWSCEIWLIWSTNLVLDKWIYPSTIIPTHPPLKFGQKLAIPTKSQKFIRSRETPCTRAIGTPCPRDPVHMGLTYPVRTGHPETFGHFLFFLFLFHHHPSCSSAPFHVFVECSVAISLVS